MEKPLPDYQETPLDPAIAAEMRRGFMAKAKDLLAQAELAKAREIISNVIVPAATFDGYMDLPDSKNVPLWVIENALRKIGDEVPDHVYIAFNKVASLVREGELLRAGLLDALAYCDAATFPDDVFQQYSDERGRLQELARLDACPICGGDCASANPPVLHCPMRSSSITPKDTDR